MGHQRSRQRDPKSRLCQARAVCFNHPSQGNSTNYSIILGPLDKAAPPTGQQNRAIPSEARKVSTSSSFFIFISSSYSGELCSQPIRGKVRRTGRIFPEHDERSFLDPEYNFVPVRRITRSRFAKQTFAQLRTKYVRRSFYFILFL